MRDRTRCSICLNNDIFFSRKTNKISSIILNKLTVTESDLFISFKNFLTLGRCLGIIPLEIKPNDSSLTRRARCIAGLFNLFCLGIILLNACIAIIDALRRPIRTSLDIANCIVNPMFALWGLFIYSYFLLQQTKFFEIDKIWKKYNSYLVLTQRDNTLKWNIVIVSSVMFASTILENALLNMEYFVVFDDINGHNALYGKEQNKKASVLEMYYFRAHPHWNMLLGSHPILSVLAFISHKFVLYGGNYVDVMISLFARALYFKFRALYEVAEEILLKPIMLLEDSDTHLSSESDHYAWKQMAKDHSSLSDVLCAMNAFFSPLIFVSYTINIYFFCMQLLKICNPDVAAESVVHYIYSRWSFIHITVRMFLLTLCLAKVHEYAHKIRHIVNHCPVELYNGRMEKLDKRINNGMQLGFTGLDCFIVSKPFMLSLLGVVFTMEIVLLQGIALSQKSINACDKCT